MTNITNIHWAYELVELIRKAHILNKLLKQPYYNLIFTPKGLAEQILKGRFRWGIINWELIERNSDIKIDFPDPIYWEMEELMRLVAKETVNVLS